jgi:PBP1b-binding outer membrane lipoprotein LpoB
MMRIEKTNMKIRHTLIAIAVVFLSGCSTLEAIQESWVNPTPEDKAFLDSMNFNETMRQWHHW